MRLVTPGGSAAGREVAASASGYARWRRRRPRWARSCRWRRERRSARRWRAGTGAAGSRVASCCCFHAPSRGWPWSRPGTGGRPGRRVRHHRVHLPRRRRGHHGYARPADGRPGPRRPGRRERRCSRAWDTVGHRAGAAGWAGPCRRWKPAPGGSLPPTHADQISRQVEDAVTRGRPCALGRARLNPCGPRQEKFASST